MWILTHVFFAETFQPMNAAVTFQIGSNYSARAIRGKFTFAGAWESCRGIRTIYKVCVTNIMNKNVFICTQNGIVGHIVFYPSLIVILSHNYKKKLSFKFTIPLNYKIFGMHTLFMNPLTDDSKSNDCGPLIITFQIIAYYVDV